MTLTILVWIVIAVAVLGLAWLIYMISGKLNTDTKTMSIPERLKWTYPSWMEWMMNIEFEEDEILFVLQGIPTSMYKKIARTNIEHHILTATEEFNHSGIVVRRKDLAEVLRAINFAPVSTIQLEDRKDIRIISVESKDHQLRVESFLQNYLEGIRGIHITEADSKVLEKRRAYQDLLSQFVKIERSEAEGELSTEEAHSSRERWAYKLYDDLLHHPDILRIDIQKKPGSILVYTDDIVVQESGDLPAAQGRKGIMLFLGKMIVEINLSTGETRYFHENGRMCSTSDHQAPHVQSDGRACWGSHTEVVSNAVEARNYLKGIQEALNFLKYANTKDAWGETAFKLAKLDQSQVEEIERNKLKRAKKRVPNKIP
ncbi:hypothetical protein KA013_05100, partial [Patescibacteria group bacterium]|nr:hypothetical protein [Patescibacteria group bacterium]